MNSGLTGIINSYRTLGKSEREFVLATIIETAGSTYRKPGARMLITESGKFYGLLGGGCFEADLLEHARKVFENKKPAVVYYDMRAPEDLIWGLGLGCNGAVRILLEHLSPDNDFAPLSLIDKALQKRQRCVVISVCESDHDTIQPGRHFCLFATPGDTEDTGKVPAEFHEAALSSLASGESCLRTIMVDDRPVKVFMAVTLPPVHLAVIGGGPDAVPVTRAAAILGWDVTVIDYRESYSRKENFPEADRVILSAPEELKVRLDPAAVDAVVLMTHKFEYDLRYLRQLAPESIPYIGLLGPAARRDELLKSIDGDLPETAKKNVYGPVGLDIGGELPEEIAFSLVAEIQAVLHKRHGGHLSDKANEKKRIGADSVAAIVLAAGGSTRFGALKQLLEFDGRSFLKHTVEMATQVFGKRVIVVHGPKATKCQREISGFDVVNIVNCEWQRGLSSSLKLAIESVPSGCQAAMVLLCDQPLIRTEHLQALISAWSDNREKIVASEYAGTVGAPAIIPEAYFPDVRQLQGDQGAKTVLAGFKDKLLSIPVPEAEFDIDTQDDFAVLLGKRLA